MWTNLIVTAYCSCKLCCGPTAYNVCADGHHPLQGITAAASRDLPLGSRLYIDKVGWRTVEDRLNHKFDNRVDIYFKKHSKAKQFGIRKEVKVWIQTNNK